MTWLDSLRADVYYESLGGSSKLRAWASVLAWWARYSARALVCRLRGHDWSEEAATDSDVENGRVCFSCERCGRSCHSWWS